MVRMDITGNRGTLLLDSEEDWVKVRVEVSLEVVSAMGRRTEGVFILIIIIITTHRGQVTSALENIDG